MPYKRKIRITGFVILNLLLINSRYIYSFLRFAYFDDICDGCYSIENSSTIGEAEEKGTLINSYRISYIEFKNSPLLKEAISKMNFWEEHVKMIPETTGKTFDDTLVVWSKPPIEGEVRFKLIEQNHFKDITGTFGFWSMENQFKDTISIGIFMKEEVDQGSFVYIKKSGFNVN